jgi:membrane carboxypeptidase/penicillin-binding protein PbpC
MGYVPQLVTGVWTGNNNNKAMKKGADGSRIAAPIWNQYMRAALKGVPPQSFTAPQPVVTGKGILDGQTMPQSTVTIDRLTGKLATDFTPPSTRESRSYSEVHDTLYYVNKDDPRGPVPADPTVDPMYQVWEDAVQKWATENNIVTAKPPTEYDDLHRPEYKPSVNWLSPSDGSTATNRTVTLEVNANAARGIVRVEFAVDGQYLGKTSFSPYRLTVTLPGSLERGFHAFTATAFDDIDSSAEVSVTVNVSADAPGAAIRWESPGAGAALPSFPVPLAVSVHTGDVSSVNFYYQQGSGMIKLIGTVTTSAGSAKLTWQSSPGPGTYSIWAEVVHTDATTEPGDKILVLVQ